MPGGAIGAVEGRCEEGCAGGGDGSSDERSMSKASCISRRVRNLLAFEKLYVLFDGDLLSEVIL